jgi:AcrR family transcriptional regulator
MRERLLEAAGRVFAERGYHGARVGDITSEAGTSLGNFYRHFENKNEILLAVLAPLHDELLESTGPAATSAVTAEDLIAWNTAYLRTYAAHRRLYRVTREAAAAGEDAGFAVLWKGQRQRFHQRVRDWLDTLGPAQGLDGIGSLDLVAESLMSILEQLSYVHLGLAERDPTPAHVAELGRVSGMLWHRSLFGYPPARRGR